MKIIIRLTESDLTTIIKRVIREEELIKVISEQKIPSSTTEIKKFQDWMDTIGPWVKSPSGKYVKLNKGEGYGIFGASTEAAWSKYGNQYLSNNTQDEKVTNTTQNGFVIPFAFPEYEPTIESGGGMWQELISWVAEKSGFAKKKGTVGPFGHAGVATVTPEGNVKIFEFGRYSATASKKGLGVCVSKNLGKVAKISDGKITNLENLIKIIHRNTKGEGPKYKIEYAVLSAPNINNGIAHAESVSKKPYDLFDFEISDDDSNCGTFVLEVVQKSGIEITNYCFPTPISMVRRMKEEELNQNSTDFSKYLKYAR
jgi:hypothetical protein